LGPFRTLVMWAKENLDGIRASRASYDVSRKLQ